MAKQTRGGGIHSDKESAFVKALLKKMKKKAMKKIQVPKKRKKK